MNEKIVRIAKAGDFTVVICENGTVWAKEDLSLSKMRDDWEEIAPPQSADRIIDIKQIDLHIVAVCESGKLYTKDYLFNPFDNDWDEIDFYPPGSNPGLLN